MPLRLWLAAGYYFCFYGAVGCFLPFGPVFYQRNGLSGTEIGTAITAYALAGIVAGPVFGAIADRWRVHRWVLPTITAVGAAPLLALSTPREFGSVVLLHIALSVSVSPVAGLIDSAVVDLIRGTRFTYGGVRLGGTVGFILTTSVNGFLAESLGLSSVIVLGACLLVVAAGLALGLPARSAVPALERSFGGQVGQLLRRREWVLYLVGAVLLGAGINSANTFYSPHLEAIGTDVRWIGLGNALIAICESPVFIWSGAIERRLGPAGCVRVGVIWYSLRWGLLALAGSPPTAILAMGLNGGAFAITQIGTVALIDSRSPRTLAATAQSLSAIAFWNVGAVLGNGLGGRLYDAAGGPGVFGAAALASLLAALFMWPATQGSRVADP
jgi:PPP family 3-phenylpropionic acid transporter